jgi:predicted phage-related endonuclease
MDNLFGTATSYPCGKIVTDIEQGSPEWDGIRCGLITGSKIADVMSKGKGGGESTGYANYRAQLVCERLSGCKVEGYKNAYMDRGNEDEPAARDCYSFVTGNAVEQVAFIYHPVLEYAGTSPDGLCGTDGMAEIKRKIPALHISALLKNEIPSEYIKQMQWEMACSGRLWNEYISYCPELPENMQLFVKRLYRDNAMIAEMEAAVIAFQKSIEDMIAALRTAVHN